MQPVLSLAAESDAHILLIMMQEYYAFDGHTFDQQKAHAALLDFLREPSFGRAWLICADNTPVGYVVLTFGYSLEYLGRDAFLDEFYLRESHRGMGWGRQVLEFVEEEARKFGVRSIHLEVVRQNTHAQEFYRRAGYRDHSHFLMTKWIDGGLVKPLPGTH